MIIDGMESQQGPLTVDTVEDIECFYELVNGRAEIHATPESSHARTVHRLAFHLTNGEPEGRETFTRPVIVLNRERTHFRRPDVVVIDHYPPLDDYITTPPLLAVEVVSSDSVLRDHHTKRGEYAAFGIPSYWIVTVGPFAPSILEFRLGGTEYRCVGEVVGSDVFETDAPFPVKLVPHWLTAGGPWMEHIGGE
ncbi:Uma2 family endonuclease [Nocardiopsis sediminis]|uniref:Uma2 family endonuclease n=1 Tax=Nocardiopsis sediminis TaxID=1778267 RepID=A0ABV8FKH7_9ACTN